MAEQQTLRQGSIAEGKRILNSLVLSVGEKLWPGYVKFKRHSLGQKITRQVLIRDKFTCSFCQFKAEKFQQVILNPQTNRFTQNIDDYLTTCMLCMQCHYLGARSFGKLIYLPELSQVQLNDLVRSLLIFMQQEGQIKETATALYRSLRQRSSVVEKAFGVGASDTVVFSRLLSQAGLGNQPLKGDIYSGIRLLSHKQYLEKAIVYWKHLYSADIL